MYEFNGIRSRRFEFQFSMDACFAMPILMSHSEFLYIGRHYLCVLGFYTGIVLLFLVSTMLHFDISS